VDYPEKSYFVNPPAGGGRINKAIQHTSVYDQILKDTSYSGYPDFACYPGYSDCFGRSGCFCSGYSDHFDCFYLSDHPGYFDFSCFFRPGFDSP
jgi:hypothetical protein